MDQLKILDYKCRFLCILRLSCFINRSDFQKQAFVNTDVKSCATELMHKQVLHCSFVQLYSVYLTQEQLSWAISLYLKSIFVKQNI
ncbi:hypothetical protein I79_026081 [Cricetulus griseus]|uniref:Uncharacterized protein n=1 Tax=Cricetulus griseus TaxID=10029 RepID=G3IPZ5_CRIGR|nr:hypothetical protein I79_026081 [Cricetulus griseus]